MQEQPVSELDLVTRKAVLDQRAQLQAQAVELAREAQEIPGHSPERANLYRGVQDRHAAKARLETVLTTGFLPAHGAGQLLSPRLFFVSPLFRVASKRTERERTVSMELKTREGGLLMRYSGPELRQSDGMVFMALLNLVKDTRLGEKVSFGVEELCRRTFGRYDGPTRRLLRTHIQRLQQGLIEFEEFSVQLCLRFDHPTRGPWSVRLDKDIVAIFQRSCEVWLDLSKRKALPEGLSTWLYGFIESQTRLIPMQASTLREMCGSDATDDSFLRTLRLALRELAEQGVLEPGWSVQAGVVRWMKKVSA